MVMVVLKFVKTKLDHLIVNAVMAIFYKLMKSNVWVCKHCYVRTYMEYTVSIYKIRNQTSKHQMHKYIRTYIESICFIHILILCTYCTYADVNECIDNNAGCDHTCVNIPGSYYCKCNSGYELHMDKHNCTGDCLSISKIA